MRKHSTAIALLGLLAGLLNDPRAAAAGLPDWQCGQYALSGKLHLNAQGSASFELLPDTERRNYLPLRNLRNPAETGTDGTLMKALIQVEKPGLGSIARGKLLQVLDVVDLAETRGVSFRPIKRLPCRPGKD